MTSLSLPGLVLCLATGAVRVSGNWRITYRFDRRDVEIVNYEDYH